MGDFPRKADGRGVFTAEFKRGTVQRILSGEKTLAELSRDLDISPTAAWLAVAQWGESRVPCPAVTADRPRFGG